VAACPAVAFGDDADPVVSATIGNASTPSVVSIATLKANTCQTSPGDAPALYNSNGPEPIGEPLSSNSWSLATVLECGLGVAPDGVTGVTVFRTDGTAEATLSAKDLSTQTDTFENPSELPVIDYDGEHIVYYRPWRGGSDANAGDQVTEDQHVPLAIDVYQGPLLTVTATASDANISAGGSVTFGETVTGGGGAALSYRWNFGGGAANTTSNAAAPVESFPSAGTFSVTLEVTDADGGGGADTIPITVQSSEEPPGTQANAPPTGPAQSNGPTSGGSPGKPSPTQSAGIKPARNTGAKHGATPTTGKTVHRIKPTTAAKPPTRAGASDRASTASPDATARKTTHSSTPVKGPRKRPVTAASGGQVVDGRVISEVTPLPLDASPLVTIVAASPATAPAVRRPAGTSIVAGLSAGLAILVLLGLGARHQLGWRRGSRTRLVIG
jgi:PKD domain